MSQVTRFLAYRNRLGEIKSYSVLVHAESETEFVVWDIFEEKFKTFLKARVHGEFQGLADAQLAAESLQPEYEVHQPQSRDAAINHSGGLEVCFTGFSAEEKANLKSLASEAGMFVRTSISAKLGLLVIGKKAGWRKVEQAVKRNIPRVSGQEGFLHFIATGEYHD